MLRSIDSRVSLLFLISFFLVISNSKMASNSHDVLPNTTRRIGKYAYVEPPIGQGTYGKVHLGKDTEVRLPFI